MPIYQLKNVSNCAKVGVWRITETEDELRQTLIGKGFDGSSNYQTKNKQRLKQWLATRLLLTEFFDNVAIIYDDMGKPHLDNGCFISISHSNDFVAIIVNEETHCGVDIEKISEKVERIKHKFLNPLDLENVTRLSDLTTYWGAKEALYKYYGKKEVLFIENLFIENYSNTRASFEGRIDMPDFKATMPMTSEKIEDYILVYTL